MPLKDYIETATAVALQRKLIGRKVGWLRKKLLYWLIKYQIKARINKKRD